jgi:hypothetical protein
MLDKDVYHLCTSSWFCIVKVLLAIVQNSLVNSFIDYERLANHEFFQLFIVRESEGTPPKRRLRFGGALFNAQTNYKEEFL